MKTHTQVVAGLFALALFLPLAFTPGALQAQTSASAAPTPTCTEGTPGSPGVFTISRPSAGVPLTVTYTLTGTATNGAQYTTLPTTVTFASTATDTNISVVPIDDGIPNPQPVTAQQSERPARKL